MNVLVACEESQRVCTAFREKGHNAFSCDILDCSGGHPEWHIKGNVLDILEPWYHSDGGYYIDLITGGYYRIIPKWDMIIAHPPCTYLSNAGACRLYPKKGILNNERYMKGLQAAHFFLQIAYADCERVCIENPIPSKVFNLPPCTQIIQPYEFGEPYSKKTCLWLKGLPNLQPTNILTEYKPYVSCGTSRNKGNPDKSGVSRKGGAQKVRSKTFWGIARAMAEQWG